MVGLIYLASPYSHNNPKVREFRFLMARLVTVRALREGHAIFSPIVYGRDMEKQIGTDHHAWLPLNTAMLEAAKEMWVLKLDQWEASKGIIHEVSFARERQLPIVYLEAPEV